MLVKTNALRGKANQLNLATETYEHEVAIHHAVAQFRGSRDGDRKRRFVEGSGDTKWLVVGIESLPAPGQALCRRYVDFPRVLRLAANEQNGKSRDVEKIQREGQTRERVRPKKKRG